MISVRRMVGCLAVALTVSVVVVLAYVRAAVARGELKPVSEADLQKIKDALPEKATVKPAKPRKVLIYWKCEGFFHEEGIRLGDLKADATPSAKLNPQPRPALAPERPEREEPEKK